MSKVIRAAILLTAAFSFAANSAEAQLTFYYDPDTGNVAFDTADVEDGGFVYSYILKLNEQASELRFRVENYVKITSTTFDAMRPDLIGESPLSTPMEGYFTIGDIMPTGLSENDWTSTFVNQRDYNGRPRLGEVDLGFYTYRYGGRLSSPSANFIYGQPDREFDNRWDLIDPDQLDWAESATIVYDPLSGNVTIDTARGAEGGHISWFVLESEGGFLPDNFTPWIDSPFTSATTDLIGFAADAIEPGVYSAGSILVPGLTLEEVPPPSPAPAS